MNFPFPGIGVVFDIDGLGGGYYGRRAWQILMKHLDPTRLCASVLVEGDTAATLAGRAREFCIGIYGTADLRYVRTVFQSVEERGLAAMHRRFIEKIALDPQPLPIRGTIDAAGRFVAEEWDADTHTLCREAQWSYAPRRIPDGLRPEVIAELEELRRPRIDHGYGD